MLNLNEASRSTNIGIIPEHRHLMNGRNSIIPHTYHFILLTFIGMNVIPAIIWGQLPIDLVGSCQTNSGRRWGKTPIANTNNRHYHKQAHRQYSHMVLGACCTSRLPTNTIIVRSTPRYHWASAKHEAIDDDGNCHGHWTSSFISNSLPSSTVSSRSPLLIAYLLNVCPLRGKTFFRLIK